MSSHRDENRPSTLVAFRLGAKGPEAGLTATVRAVQAAVGIHGGRMIRTQEPRVAEFSRPDRAFAFAVEALRMVARHNELHSASPLDVGLGAHFDTVWFVGDDVIGDAPNVAVGLAESAEPGTMLASAAALSRLPSTTGWEIAERGKRRIAGIEAEIPVLQARPRAALLKGASPQPGVAAGAAAPFPRPGVPATPPLPPPGVVTPAQEIISGLKQIGRAVVNELAERSRNISEEKVRAALRGHGHHHGGRYRYTYTYGAEAEGDEALQPMEAPKNFLEQRKARVARRARGAVAGFFSHAASWAVVGAGLIVLNVLTRGGFPWAFFPIAGWGIGLACHWQGVRSARRKHRQIKNLESVSPEQLRLIEKIQNTATGFGAHAAAYISVNAFLAGVNFVTGGGHLWFLYPLAGWGIGFFLHWVNQIARRRALAQELRDTGISWSDIRSGRKVTGGHRILGGPTRVAPNMEHYELVREANTIRDRLLGQMAQDPELAKRMGEDAKELLSTYSDQLEKLVLRNDEFTRAVSGMSEASLTKELEDYRARLGTTEHAALKREYEKAVDQSERHLKSIRELRHQKEIMDLRIQSSFGLLRQLELDFVRLKTAESAGELEGLQSIRSKSNEISDYLEGLDETERDG